MATRSFLSDLPACFCFGGVSSAVDDDAADAACDAMSCVLEEDEEAALVASSVALKADAAVVGAASDRISRCLRSSSADQSRRDCDTLSVAFWASFTVPASTQTC